MQIDMHFYSTYAIARYAGFEKEDANIIATAAQFVDDATSKNSEKNENSEMLFAIKTAHHNKDAIATSFFHPEVHRLVWVPFHFYPGGEGESLEEKLLCTKDSDLVNAMFDNHIKLTDKSFYLHILGISAHVYMDTFSHYGFSGICSKFNEVEADSFNLDIKDGTIKEYVEKKTKSFFDKLITEMDNMRNSIVSNVGEGFSRGLGHGAVSTYPDRPYLTWEFTYEEERYGNSKESGKRNNQKTFLEGLEKLYDKLVTASRKKYKNPSIKPLPIENIKDILSHEAKKEDRIKDWQKLIKKLDGDIVVYKGDDWNKEKDDFSKTKSPNHIGDCYKFHQGATYHRWYTLKDLLPEHNIYAV